MQDVEWDSAKDASNRQKHGTGFVGATTVFGDPYRIVEDSTRPEHGEGRRKTIGRMGPVLIVVISTDRDGRRRIISARRASQDERRRCDQGASTI